MQRRPSPRRPPKPFVPSPPPGAGSERKSSQPAGPLRLPSAALGAPPGRPPGATRPPPRLGGLRGVGAPPEIRRRTGNVRAAPGAAAVAGQIRETLARGQQKLLESQRKLQSSVAALRALLTSRD